MAGNPRGFGAALALSALFIAGVLYYAVEDITSAKATASSWVSPVVSPGELLAVEWMRGHSSERERVMACIFEGEMLMGHSLREGLEGGDWAIVPNVVRQMGDVNEFFSTRDSGKAWRIAKDYGATMAWAPKRQQFCGFGWAAPESGKFANTTYFERIFDSKDVSIYRVA